VQRASGIPTPSVGERFINGSGDGAASRERAFAVIARSEATKQSILSLRGKMDCFAEPVIGRRFAPTRWLAMT